MTLVTATGRSALLLFVLLGQSYSFLAMQHTLAWCRQPGYLTAATRHYLLCCLEQLSWSLRVLVRLDLQLPQLSWLALE